MFNRRSAHYPNDLVDCAGILEVTMLSPLHRGFIQAAWGKGRQSGISTGRGVRALSISIPTRSMVEIIPGLLDVTFQELSLDLS